MKNSFLFVLGLVALVVSSWAQAGNDTVVKVSANEIAAHLNADDSRILMAALAPSTAATPPVGLGVDEVKLFGAKGVSLVCQRMGATHVCSLVLDRKHTVEDALTDEFRVLLGRVDSQRMSDALAGLAWREVEGAGQYKRFMSDDMMAHLTCKVLLDDAHTQCFVQIHR